MKVMKSAGAIRPRTRTSLRSRCEVLPARDGIDHDSLRRKAKDDPQFFASMLSLMADARAEYAVDGELSAPMARELEEYKLTTRELRKWSFAEVSDLPGLQQHYDFQIKVPQKAGSQRAVMTDAFPVLTSSLAVAGVNEAFMMVPDVLQFLVTDLNDPKKTTDLIGALSLKEDSDAEVPEKDPFHHLEAGEERFTILHKRYGYQVAIQQELIDENNRAEIMQRITDLGRIAQETIQRVGLRQVTDHDGSASSGAQPFLLHIDGSTQAFFVTNNNAPLTRLPSNGSRVTNNALTSETQVEAARSRLAGMTNSRGERIHIPLDEHVMLVPDALWVTAHKILNSMLTPGVQNEANFFGPRGPGSGITLVSTPLLDDLSTSAWYYGAPRRLLVRKWKLAPEVVTVSGRGTMPFLETREGFRTRVAWDMRIGARDYTGWLQNTSGTTAPKDE